MTDIWVKRYVEQSVKDPGYLGYVEYLETRLDYTVVLPSGVAWLSKPQEYTLREVRDHFILSLLRNGRVIHLENDEYRVFFGLLAGVIKKFVGDSRLGKINDGILGKAAKVLDLDLGASLWEFGRISVSVVDYGILTRMKFRRGGGELTDA